MVMKTQMQRMAPDPLSVSSLTWCETCQLWKCYRWTRLGRRGRVGSTSDCRAVGQRLNPGIPPLLKHACDKGDWLLCWHYTPAKVSHQRWILGNIYHIHLRKVQIRQNPLWLWNPEETSPEVRNRGISGPTNGHVSNKIFFKKKQKKTRLRNSSVTRSSGNNMSEREVTIHRVRCHKQ